MLVDGHREGGAAVAEALADDLHRYAGLEQDRGVGIAQVVQADPRQRRLGDVAVEELAEVVGVNGLAVRESFFVSFLGTLGVPADRAFATGFLFFVVTIALSLPGAGIVGWEALRRGARRAAVPR